MLVSVKREAKFRQVVIPVRMVLFLRDLHALRPAYAPIASAFARFEDRKTEHSSCVNDVLGIQNSALLLAERSQTLISFTHALFLSLGKKRTAAQFAASTARF